MTFNKYQIEAKKTAVFPEKLTLSYLPLGLCGESGEVAEKVKKIIRDKESRVTYEDAQDLAKELGDVLWYIANFADFLGLSLSEIADMNIKKLKSRMERGQIKGSGDNR